MKILYLVKKEFGELDVTVQRFIVEQKKEHEVTLANITLEKNHEMLLDMIAQADRVISW